MCTEKCLLALLIVYLLTEIGEDERTQDEGTIDGEKNVLAYIFVGPILPIQAEGK